MKSIKLFVIIGCLTAIGVSFNSCGKVNFSTADDLVHAKGEEGGETRDGDLGKDGSDSSGDTSGSDQSGDTSGSDQPGDTSGSDATGDVGGTDQPGSSMPGDEEKVPVGAVEHDPALLDDLIDLHPCVEDNELGVQICHIPSGNPAAKHTICIGRPALKAHYDVHGDHDEFDYFGPCE